MNINMRTNRKPIVIYQSNDYIIENIPDNLRATIKCAVNPKEIWRGIDREYYCHPEHGVEHLKEIVEDVIKHYFLSGVKPTIPKGLKAYHGAKTPEEMAL